MKKITIIIIILISNVLVLGQELNKKHYLDFKNFEYLEKGNVNWEIKERVNYEIFLKVQDLNNHFKEPTEEEKILSKENIVLKLKKGNYTLQNEYQKFKFEVDDNGLFDGDAYLEMSLTRYMHYWNFKFENGKLKYAVKTDTLGSPIFNIINSDTLITLNSFDKNTSTFRLRRTFNYTNSDEKKYYKNGNLAVEENITKRTKKQFYENGKQEYFENLNTNEVINYDTMGRKKNHSYEDNSKKWCGEDYENGVIIKKRCYYRDQSGRPSSEYYYKNGKLTYYTVEDHKIGEIRKYDSKNKLLNKEKVLYKNAN